MTNSTLKKLSHRNISPAKIADLLEKHIGRNANEYCCKQALAALVRIKNKNINISTRATHRLFGTGTNQCDAINAIIKQIRSHHWQWIDIMPISLWKLLLHLFWFLPSISMAQNVKTNEEYNNISQCFWVYASIHELGRELKSQEILSFTEPRIRWYQKYLSENQKNNIFANAFELNAEERKYKSLALKSRMKRAISTKNKLEYSGAVNEMIHCDKILDMSTKLTPKLRNQ